MQRRLRFKPSRAAFGTSTDGSDGTNAPFYSLYNDSTAAYLLAVMDYGTNPGSSGGIQAIVVAQGKLGSNPQQGQALVTGRGNLPGQVLSGVVASPPGMNIFFGGGGGPQWYHDYPIAVLSPGWSFTVYSQAMSTPWAGSFIWQYITPDELDALFEEIDLSVG
jgi:hypothetical protein